MSGLMLAAALLLLLAVAFAVSALWATSRRLAIALAVALPVAAIGLYLWRGTPQSIEAPAAMDAAQPADATTPTPDFKAMVSELEAGLARDPSRWDGWNLLGNIRLEQGDHAAARAAFAKAHELRPGDDAVAIGYAEALMRTSPDQRFPPEAVVLLERAARAEPPLPKAVLLLGRHRLDSGQPGAAADLWESLLPDLDPAAAAKVREQVAKARASAAGNVAPAPGTIAITVAPAAALAQQADAGGILFVFARAKGGGPPVAAKRLVVERWPVTLALGDADRPMSEAKLSTQDKVLLVARLSRSGDATAASGDLESTPVEVRVAAGATATLRLETVRP